MSKAKKECGWVTVAQAAPVFGMTTEGFRRTVKPTLPVDAINEDESPTKVYGPVAIEIWAAKRLAKASKGVSQGDPLLDGVMASPALERYRDARADLAELERDERRGRLASLDDLEPTLVRFDSVMRGGGERLQREFGPEAAKIWNEIVHDAMRILRALDGHDSGNGQPSPN